MTLEKRDICFTVHGKDAYSYEIGLKYRLMYRVKFERKEIEFLAVGTHKIY